MLSRSPTLYRPHRSSNPSVNTFASLARFLPVYDWVVRFDIRYKERTWHLTFCQPRIRWKHRYLEYVGIPNKGTFIGQPVSIVLDQIPKAIWPLLKVSMLISKLPDRVRLVKTWHVILFGSRCSRNHWGSTTRVVMRLRHLVQNMIVG